MLTVPKNIQEIYNAVAKNIEESQNVPGTTKVPGTNEEVVIVDIDETTKVPGTNDKILIVETDDNGQIVPIDRKM